MLLRAFGRKFGDSLRTIYKHDLLGTVVAFSPRLPSEFGDNHSMTDMTGTSLVMIPSLVCA